MLLSHRRPSWRTKHGCTVGVDKDPPCDDPPRQDGESPKRQLLRCVVASACVVVLLCGCHVRDERAPWMCSLPTKSIHAQN